MEGRVSPVPCPSWPGAPCSLSLRSRALAAQEEAVWPSGGWVWSTHGRCCQKTGLLWPGKVMKKAACLQQAPNSPPGFALSAVAPTAARAPCFSIHPMSPISQPTHQPLPPVTQVSYCPCIVPAHSRSRTMHEPCWPWPHAAGGGQLCWQSSDHLCPWLIPHLLVLLQHVHPHWCSQRRDAKLPRNHLVGASTPLSPTPGGYRDHSVHSLHRKEGALLVMDRVFCGGSLLFRREEFCCLGERVGWGICL